MTASECRVVAVIPARGGSKGVPGKNLRTVGGRSLISRAVMACSASRLVDLVYASTDDAAIAAAAQASGADVIWRPRDLAGDHASSESALLHALDHLATVGVQPEVLIFVQCTSPFINPGDLDAAVEMILTGHADTVFSGVATHEFLWREAPDVLGPKAAAVVGQNHDAASRPRRQDRRPDFRETGAFYAMRIDDFRRSGHRFFGTTAVVPVPELTSMEIDTPDDLVLANALATVLERAKPAALEVDAVVTDFDGVHTADTAYLDETGREAVRVSRSDGLGIARLRASGVPMLILSKECNPVVSARGRKVGVEVMQGVDDKAAALQEWLDEQGIPLRRTAYLGNDVNDLPAMQIVGWPVAVSDAHPRVRAAARLVLARAGGHGAVRELCDLVLDSHVK
ncbi:MAG TPA: acylneuraminate cytidylyltransferase [Propionibacteriaceae bacterium]|nr:acylneuraminate cytidylyltransferase [Propionibacteriaceae bacterium]